MISILDALARLMAPEAVTVDMTLPAGASVRRSRALPTLGGRLAGMSGPASAVTLGRTIVLHPGVAPTPQLLRHELVHVAQWMREPMVFPFRYINAHIRHGYHANPFELEARAAENGSGTTGETA